MRKVRLNEYQLRYKKEKLSQMRYLGLQTILVDRIKGSVNRWHEFNHQFLPEDADQKKLKSVIQAIENGVVMPPISVFKISDDFYVVDGNHRVSIAKQSGQIYIDAEVNELLPPGDSLEHLLWREKSGFEWKTGLTLNFSEVGSYNRVLTYIRLLAKQVLKNSGIEMALKDAAKMWFEEIYQPIAKTVDSGRVKKCFPSHTVDDLCLYIIHHQLTKTRFQGKPIDLKEAVITFGLYKNQDLIEKIKHIFKGVIITKKCNKLCLNCIRSCPEGLICACNGKLSISDQCQGCGKCAVDCPEKTLASYSEIV